MRRWSKRENQYQKKKKRIVIRILLINKNIISYITERRNFISISRSNDLYGLQEIVDKGDTNTRMVDKTHPRCVTSPFLRYKVSCKINIHSLATRFSIQRSPCKFYSSEMRKLINNLNHRFMGFRTELYEYELEAEARVVIPFVPCQPHLVPSLHIISNISTSIS